MSQYSQPDPSVREYAASGGPNTHRMAIKGGAGEFEAVIIAVVLDRIAGDEKVARTGQAGNGNALPAWVRVLQSEADPLPLELKRPS